MKFCPNCETRMRLKFVENQVACPKCGFAISEQNSTVTINVSNVTTQEHNALRVLDAENTTEVLPTLNIECPKCNNNLAVWWMLQTRSAD
ncbi:MAG TPA: RPA12/RPB9/RPC11 RNA polymerase family protein, partial [Nitrososphaeraceae archaeon]|nr:RPA12/RPB9/RPC11 RNA polymerase family protein [Nitrososphaeraceae archaeon]